MSKTTNKTGWWEGAWGEVPALGRRGYREDLRGNLASGIAETRELGHDGGPDPETPIHPAILEAERLPAEVDAELARIRALRTLPVSEWPDADVERLRRVLCGRR